MSSPSDFDFDFDFGSADRSALLNEANRTVTALGSELSQATGTSPTAAVAAASNLLSQLDQEIAAFSSYPEVLELKEEHFSEHGLPVPTRFKDLSRQYRFYWVRFPVTLRPLDNMPFNKLKVAVEFNPGSSEGHLRPRAQMILPDRKFQQLLEFNTSLDLRIGENFEFEVATGNIDLQAGAAKAKAQADVDAKVAGKLGLMAGPFTYRFKKALLDHSGTGSEKVFWTLSGAEFFQEDDPTLLTVLQVPKAVDRVEIAAALQAYHYFDFPAAGLGAIVRYLSERVATFFRKGAPIPDKKVWDITPSL